MAEDTTPETADEVEEFTISRESVSPATAELVAAATGGGGAPEQTVRFEDDAAPAGDLRARLTTAVEDAECKHYNELGYVGDACSDCITAAVLAELAADPGDLTARTASAMHAVDCGCDDDHDDWHQRLAVAALSVSDERVVHLAARLAEAERRAEHFEGELASVRDHNTQWEREKARADRAETEVRRLRAFRDEVLGDLSEAVRALAVHRTRAEAAEAERDRYCEATGIWTHEAYERRARAEAAEAQVAALQRERHATLIAIHGARMAHIREAHPTRIVAGDEVCQAFVAIDRDMPSRPDDLDELTRRLTQATTEETSDGH